uniref:DUF3881 family protein n=1 Tax=Agathobacter sp. TaxID=2021311 RepID=UPI0040578889
MHRFLRAVGFSDIRKRDLEMIFQEIIEHPNTMKITKDSEGKEFAELTKEFARNIGITIRGSYDDEDMFHVEYYFPHVFSDEITTMEQIEIEKYAEKESYAGICDEVRLGVTLVFYLQNVADFLSKLRYNRDNTDLRGAYLSALSVEGKILLPIEQSKPAKMKSNHKYEVRKRLMAEARDGNEEAIENLTIQDMNMYSDISQRIVKEDLLSIVSSTFMPYSIESDQYHILGEITEVSECINILTKEKLYTLTLDTNDIIFNVTINEKDLLGKPEIGRRFKGYIWMQGTVCV